MRNTLSLICKVIILGASLSGCVSSSPSQSSLAKEDKGEQQRLYQIIAAQKAEIEKLRNTNSLLQSRAAKTRGEQASLQTAQALFDEARHAEALKEVNLYLGQKPGKQDLPKALALKADILGRLKLPSFAQSVWSQILKEFPESAEARRARIQLKHASATQR